MLRIELEDGKYTYIRRGRGVQRALRYGEEWRDLTGDGFVYALGWELVNLRAERDTLAAGYNKLKERHEREMTAAEETISKWMKAELRWDRHRKNLVGALKKAIWARNQWREKYAAEVNKRRRLERRVADAVATLRNDLYKNRVNNALAVLEDEDE